MTTSNTLNYIKWLGTCFTFISVYSLSYPPFDIYWEIFLLSIIGNGCWAAVAYMMKERALLFINIAMMLDGIYGIIIRC